MKRLTTLLLPAAASLGVLLFVAPEAARSGWGGASCAPVWSAPTPAPAPVQVVSPPQYAWTPYGDRDPHYMKLVDAARGGEMVGAYRFGDHTFHWLLGEDFGGACPPPIPAPPDPPCSCDRCGKEGCRCKKQDDCRKAGAALPGDSMPTGVVTPMLSPEGTEKCLINGRPASKDEMMQALAEPQLPDDSAKPSLSAIGTTDACKKAHDALPAETLAAVAWQDYRPDDVMVKEFGFVSTGDPEVYLQDKGGKVLYRADKFCLADVVDAVRKADPNYNPAADPSGKSADPVAALVEVLVVQVRQAPWWVWVGLLVLALLYLRSRTKKA